MATYYVFVKENYFRPVKIEAESIFDAVDKVAYGKGKKFPLEHHSTAHWSEWVVEAQNGVRYYHSVGIGYVKF